MNLDPGAQAVALLTVSFGKAGKAGARPLSAKEWACFATWLKDHDLEPSALLKGDTEALLSGWTDRSITLPRLASLLDRGGALGLVLEKWQRAGLWMITWSDPEYPERLKRQLRSDAPPVLFGCGNKTLLQKGGIAVVGSRNAGQDDLAYAENLGKSTAQQGRSVVSGGARGVDESAMLGALKNEGTAIGVMADSLLRAATSAKYRKYLLSNELVLVTPFSPEAEFNVGNAMSRNRYIYCLADAAVVVCCTPDKGGTWHGAIKNLKSKWVPLWVKHTESAESGNPELARRGAHWLTSLDCLLNGPPSEPAKDERPDPPLLGGEAERPTSTTSETKVSEPSALDSGLAEAGLNAAGAEGTPTQGEVDFYALFLDQMVNLTSNDPMKLADIELRLDLHKSQVKAWLQRGVEDGKIKKLTRPVRYQSTRQPSLFGDNG